MASQERIDLLQHLGYTLLDDSQVEIRKTIYGTFAVLKNPDPLQIRAIQLANPADVEARFKPYRERAGDVWAGFRNYAALPGEPLFFHPDYPLRLEGRYVTPVGGEVAVFNIGPDGEQLKWVLRAGYVRRNEVSARNERILTIEGYDLFTLPGVGRPGSSDRAQFLHAFAHMVNQRARYADDHDLHLQALHQTDRLTTILGYTPWGSRPLSRDAEWRTILLSGAQFLELRDRLRRIGKMIAGTDDAGTLLDELDRWVRSSDIAHGFQARIVAAWNKVHPLESELRACTCGHVEVSDEVTHGRNSATICRSCIDDGRYQWAENIDTYDLADNLYQHDDGLYYTYSEDDGDHDDYGSVKNYGADVRGYLKADKKINSSAYGDFLMGIELEVQSTGNSRSRAVTHTLNHLAEGYAILKNDGSLDEDLGFEIVTAPRGLAEHLKRFSDWTPHHELEAWDAKCCGMHVHIDSRAFTQATLGKFIEFINATRNDRLIHAIAGRHPSTDGQASSYCQRDGCTVGNPKQTLCDKSADRYYMVNTTNVTSQEATRLGLNDNHVSGRQQNTIELRIFRASLKKSRLLAQIEFAHAAVMFCRWSSMRELDAEHFITWLRGMAGVYPNLAKWFGVKANTDKVEAKPKAREGAEV